MRQMLILGLLVGVLPLTGCSGPLEVDGQTNWIELWADQIAQSAILTIEFAERENQVGQIGWHLTLSCDGDIRLSESASDLQDRLYDAGHNVLVDNVQCVRWNVNYQNGRYLCEGNANTAYAPDVIADTELDWLGQNWAFGTWSDPDGYGCSALACR